MEEANDSSRPVTPPGPIVAGDSGVASLPPKTGVTRRELSPRERVEEGFARVVDLIESIQGHFTAQDERAQQMTRSLDRIAESLAHLPEALNGQTESLEEIRSHLHENMGEVKRLEDTLSQLPRLADAQRETMVTVGRQLDVLREGGEHSTATLRDLGQAVTRLGEATSTSTTTLKTMHLDSVTREDRMVNLVQEQTRRLTLFASAAIALAVIAVVVGLVALLS